MKACQTVVMACWQNGSDNSLGPLKQYLLSSSLYLAIWISLSHTHTHTNIFTLSLYPTYILSLSHPLTKTHTLSLPLSLSLCKHTKVRMRTIFAFCSVEVIFCRRNATNELFDQKQLYLKLKRLSLTAAGKRNLF